MQYTRLGETELEVSRICFGTWQLGGEWGPIDVDEAITAIRRALDLGVNFFDTAQVYGWGVSEARLSEALRPEIERHRGDIVLATKGGLRPVAGGVVRDAGRDWLRQGLDESLGHLHTDYVDLYQIHWPDDDTAAEETAGALAEFVAEGSVRYVGVSNYSAKQMQALERHIDLDALQPPYHLFRRDVEKHVLPYCWAHGVGTLVYGPLAHGLLGGRYDETTTFHQADWRSRSSAFTGEGFRRNLAVVERLKEFAAHRNMTVAQLAIAWTLAHPAVDVAIVGCRTAEQVDGMAAAADLALDDHDLAEIERLSADRLEIGGASPEGID
jgi:aryl-alcohol dehydrogenase-like predicted oxidoreductase